ncbi:MAG: epoxyqueuosine reductase [Acidimicrobiales bacterium]
MEPVSVSVESPSTAASRRHPDTGRATGGLEEALRAVGTAAGLSAVGFTTAEVLEPARSVLTPRREAGLSGSMQFTYRNPDRSTDPGRLFRGVRSLVVGVAPYPADVPAPPSVGHPARVARYSAGHAYGRLHRGLAAVADRLRGHGHRTVTVADDNALVDRNAAWRAGLGWWGKNTNLLTPDHGSFVVIGAVATDAVLTPSGPPRPDGCGPCEACLDGCPTGALIAPGVLDARRCIAWLVQAAEPIPAELRPAIGDRIYGCDICQEVCPATPRTDGTRPAADPARRGVDAGEPTAEGGTVGGGSTGGGTAAEAWVEVEWILAASNKDILGRYGHWYLAGRDPDVVRRTALVILGNTAAPEAPGVELIVRRHLRHPNPLIRSHALWAARRLGYDHLAAPLTTDDDPMVRAEWAHRVERRPDLQRSHP